MNAETQRFLFESRFDADESSLGKVHRKRSKEELQAEQEKEQLRAAAFEEGKAAGRAEAEGSTAQTTAQALTQIGTAMERLHAESAAIHEDMVADATRVALALVRKFLPELSKRNALNEIEGLIESAIGDLAGEPRIVVRVHDGLLDALRGHIDQITTQSGYAGDVVLIADPGLAMSDCRIEWADGGIERDTERLWREVDQAAARICRGNIKTGTDAGSQQEMDGDVRPDSEPNQPTTND